MDIRQLYYFREIVRQGGISKAAEVLHIAQPPLSQLLKKLEEDFGTTLIHRYRQKWELTETGELLFRYAEQTLKEMQDVRQRIQEIEQGITGVVSIGVASVCTNILIDYVSLFRKQYPQIKINITTGNSDELLKKLNRKEIDIALLLRSDNIGQYRMEIINKQPFVVMIPKSWLASFSSPNVTLEQIAKFPFILLGPMEGHSFHEILLETFHERNLKPNVVMECKDVTMVIELVSRELGLSIIPRMDYSSPFLKNIMFLELEEIKIDVEPAFLRLKDEPISKAAIQFWGIVE
ncbi:LysR family transcriptional regulator [Cohnella pontilimi]|uniref:LysR family transcriptional regulator n=1 Tax=Cohnella pontilimi TaxID=2564100 RepID=A0A4U0FC25_9BACL|nr:LysR family transcriptional regulator [Cohnella pontilimi]TJY41764.1 LysR family transcriptional regulator [Cohnella pontilimi]